MRTGLETGDSAGKQTGEDGRRTWTGAVLLEAFVLCSEGPILFCFQSFLYRYLCKITRKGKILKMYKI